MIARNGVETATAASSTPRARRGGRSRCARRSNLNQTEGGTKTQTPMFNHLIKKNMTEKNSLLKTLPDEPLKDEIKAAGEVMELQGPIKYAIIRGDLRADRNSFFNALPDGPLKDEMHANGAELRQDFTNSFYSALTPTQRERVDKYFPRAVAAGYMQDNCPYTVTGYYWTGAASHLAWFLYKVLCPTKNQSITEEIRDGLWRFFDFLFDFTSMKFPPAREIDIRVQWSLINKVFYD